MTLWRSETEVYDVLAVMAELVDACEDRLLLLLDGLW